MTGNSSPKILPKLKKKVYLKINDFSKKICVLSILFRGTPPFSLPHEFHCCDLTLLGFTCQGGPALWDGDTIKMPGMQVPAGGHRVEGWKLCIRGVPMGSDFLGFSQRRKA